MTDTPANGALVAELITVPLSRPPPIEKLRFAANGFVDSDDVTWIAVLNAPTPVGVPLTSPELERFRPGGMGALLTAQMYGGTPPRASSGCAYGVPKVSDVPASGSDEYSFER